MLRALALFTVLAVMAPAGPSLAARVKTRSTMRTPRSGPPTGIRARIKGFFFGRRGQAKPLRGSQTEAAQVELDRWMSVLVAREPTRTRSPLDYKLSNFRPRSGPKAHNRGDSVKAIGARALWVDAEVALVRTDTGPDIFLPTRGLDDAARQRLAAGARITIDVVYHGTGGVVASNPRFDAPARGD